MRIFVDCTGEVFGRLIVVSRAPKDKAGRHRWLCRCQCGTLLTVRTGNLRRGTTKSCGCLRKEAARLRFTKHGLHQTSTYKIWKGMRIRCRNINYAKWGDYGGRGIRVCERWENFENFLADMGSHPSGTSIERIDNDGDYEPGNCLWATQTVQSRNTRRNRRVTVCGKQMLIMDACDVYGVQKTSVWSYRARKRITLTEAFFDLLERRLATSWL